MSSGQLSPGAVLPVLAESPVVGAHPGRWMDVSGETEMMWRKMEI